MSPSCKTLHQNDKKWLWKFILRATSIFLAAAGIGCIAWALSSTSSLTLYYEYANSHGASSIFWGLISLGVSIFWNVGNIAILLSLNQAMHPGANVGCDLGLLIFLFATGIMLADSAAHHIPNDFYEIQSDHNYPDEAYSALSFQEYENPYRRQGIMEAVGSGLTFVVMLCHFALFVSACRFLHQRRRSRVPTQAAAIAREIVAEITINHPLAPAQQPVAEGQRGLSASGDQAQSAQQQPYSTTRGEQSQSQPIQETYPTSDSQAHVFPQEPQATTSWILPHQYSPNETFVSVPRHQTTSGNELKPARTRKTKNTTPNASASHVPHKPSWTSPLVSPQSPTLGRYDHLSSRTGNFRVGQSTGKR